MAWWKWDSIQGSERSFFWNPEAQRGIPFIFHSSPDPYVKTKFALGRGVTETASLA
jgi:hypothetical protein